MRILHITTTRTGSTGRTATDLKTFITSLGEEYKIAYSEPDDKPIDGDILIGSRFDHKIHAFLSRVTGLQGYWSHLATWNLLRQVDKYHPDIVQLGNLHANYINLPMLFRYLIKKQIPVVMILHDCWFFTGKCTHFTASECDKWKTYCYHCPVLKRDNVSWFFDYSSKMFRDRQKWYSRLTSHMVIAVSDWEKNLATQSPLFSKADVIRIYNWIDPDTFHPASDEEKMAIRHKYGLDSSRRYIISVSGGWSSGTTKMEDAIAFANQLPNSYHLIMVGKATDIEFPKNIIHVPYTANLSELSILYSLSEAYLHFSVEDTFGKVIAEAMACGTVPIVFDSTACGETAGPYGYTVAPHDISAMVEATLSILPDDGEKVRKYALENYQKSLNINKYWKQYKNFLSK